MRTSKARWTQDSEGTWICFLVGRVDMEAVLAGITEGRAYDVTVKEHRQRRSLDANAYFWVLCGKLADKLSIPKTEVYRRYIREIGGNSETICVLEKAADKLEAGWRHNGLGWITERDKSKLHGCVNVTLYYGSSTYDTRQMSRLIDMCVEDCKEAGIETLTPQELERMKVGWGRA